MKRLRNSSGIPDETVRKVIAFVADELGITAFDVECRNCSSTLAGAAYHQGSSYHSTSRPFAVLRIGTENIVTHAVLVKNKYHPEGSLCYARPGILKKIAGAEGPIQRTAKARFPVACEPYQYAQHKGRRYIIATRLEALVYITAHELRHLWQAAQHSDKRKSAPLSRFHGGTGKFSEIDTESYAIHTLRRWRKVNA